MVILSHFHVARSMVMNTQFLIIAVCLLHASLPVIRAISVDRTVTAKALFTDGTRIAQVSTALNNDTDIRTRHTISPPTSGCYVQSEIANLIQGFDASSPKHATTFQSIASSASLPLPGGELDYIENFRVYEQQLGKIAWLLSVVTANGFRIGSARFQIMERN